MCIGHKVMGYDEISHGTHCVHRSQSDEVRRNITWDTLCASVLRWAMTLGKSVQAVKLGNQSINQSA